MKKMLENYIKEYSERNKKGNCTAVYSVTNSQGFVLSTEYFSKEVYSKDLTTYKIVKYGMIAYNPSRINVGSVAVQRKKEEVVVSPLYVVISVNEEELLPEFLCYFLHSNIGLAKIAAHTSGSVRDSLKYNALKKIDISIYPICQQRDIIKKLSRLEDLIAKKKLVLQKFDDLVKSQFIEMFGDVTQNEKGWIIVPLSEIAEYYNGLTYHPEDVANEGLIVLRSSNIQNSELDFSDIVKVACKVKSKLIVKEGDILMCSRNGSAKLVGKVAQIKGLTEDMTFGAFMMIIRSQCPDYLTTYFKLAAFREQIKVGATTTINQITSNMLNKIKLPLPPKPLLDKFARFVEQTDKSKVLMKCLQILCDFSFKSVLYIRMVEKDRRLCYNISTNIVR